MSVPMLEVRGLTKHFGGLAAVKDISFSLEEGTIVGLIGPNGAGKTSLVNLISGALKPNAGRILFRGAETSRLPPFRIARLGIARTFQIVQPFAEMTVLENVAAGAMFAGSARSPRQAMDRAGEHLAFTGLSAFAASPAAALSLANRKRLELAKSLAMEPRLLLLDEVNAGLNSGEITEALALVRAIAERGVTIVVIEHLMRVVISLSSRIIVLHHGALLSDGSPDDVLSDPAIVEAYLGSKFAKRFNTAGLPA